MAKAHPTYETLKREALALPEVEESTSYGDAALKVRGKLMTRRREELGAVALRMNWEERERLMTIHPEVFFITEHYRRYPWVLLRLSAASRAQVREALGLAWRLTAPKSLVARQNAQ